MPDIPATWLRLTTWLEARLAWFPPSAARLSVGWVFAQSGWGKLQDLPSVVEFFRELGIPSPELQAPFVAGTELVCGALLLAGFATRAASLPLIVIMIVALATALCEQISTIPDLFGLSEFLYALLLCGPVVGGAGPLSLDSLTQRTLARRR